MTQTEVVGADRLDSLRKYERDFEGVILNVLKLAKKQNMKVTDLEIRGHALHWFHKLMSLHKIQVTLAQLCEKGLIEYEDRRSDEADGPEKQYFLAEQ